MTAFTREMGRVTRRLLRNPLFTIIAIATLALILGAIGIYGVDPIDPRFGFFLTSEHHGCDVVMHEDYTDAG